MLFETLILLTIIAGFTIVYFAIKKQFLLQKDQQITELVDKAFGESANKIAQLSKQILSGDKETIKVDLHNKHIAMERLVSGLREEMAVHQNEIRKAEKDRIREFSDLLKSLEQHKELTSELRVSTETLSKVLSNNQTRGAWGERIIEDLLTSNGLVEGVHFARQQKLGSSNLIPDITLLLPNKKVVPIDVKFPYAQMQKMSLAETKSLKAVHLKLFEKDVKVKIDKVAEYIDSAHDTLDYAIMFVPNEAIFSFINQQLPFLVDLAVSKRVLIVSPFTFLIVARTIMESYRNFMIGDKLKEVVKYVDEFVSEWDKFKSSFQKYGKTLSTLQKDYESLSGTRVRVMEKKITKVQNYSSGNLIVATKTTKLESSDE